MDTNEIKNSALKAAKWSAVTEIVYKIIAPITTMILARILAPEAFGILAIITMIISFTDMFTDAGFQKYLVQHEFEDDEQKNLYTTVAFWTNFGLSLFLWGLISWFREPIALLVGHPGLGNVIAISCIQLPLISFSSIQMALYKRNFEFNTLFFVRIISIIIPFVVTIPLALLGLNYWSLIIGTICGQLSNAVILTIKSYWKPKLFYNINILRDMLFFSIWTLLEALSIWFSTWIDIFLIGRALAPYYLGLYNISLSMVNALISIVSVAIVPVLFSTLSRLQNEDALFKSTFYRVQRTAAYLLFPMGLGLFLYSDLATQILLGKNWSEASFIIGIWGLTSAFKVVLSDFNSECYRAKGLPRLSFYLQMFHLAFLIPTCIIALRYGFSSLVIARAFIRFQLVISSLILMQVVLGITMKSILENVLKPFVLTLLMGIVAFGLIFISNNSIWSVISIIFCVVVYAIMMLLWAKEDSYWLLNKIKSRSYKFI